jgi:hypothetical protein
MPLQLASRYRIDPDPDRVHDQLGIGIGKGLRGGTGIALAGFLPVADQHDDVGSGLLGG